MTRNLVAACILSFACVGLGNAQGSASAPDAGPQYSQAQLKQLIREAHTPVQFRALATNYKKQQDSYLERAAEEKKEWARMSQNITGHFGKYPRPVDSVRNLYEYYMYKASKAGTLEAKYERLAAPDSLVNAQ